MASMCIYYQMLVQRWSFVVVRTDTEGVMVGFMIGEQ